MTKSIDVEMEAAASTESSGEIRRDLLGAHLIAGVSVPDSSLISEVIEYAQKLYEPYLFNHAMRSWLFAAKIGQSKGIDCDLEVVAVGTILHDIGLSAAIHLAAAGREVVVVEAEAVPGGRCGTVAVGGYRFDTGPTVLTMPELIAEPLEAVGEEHRHQRPRAGVRESLDGCAVDAQVLRLAGLEADRHLREADRHLVAKSRHRWFQPVDADARLVGHQPQPRPGHLAEPGVGGGPDQPAPARRHRLGPDDPRQPQALPVRPAHGRPGDADRLRPPTWRGCECIPSKRLRTFAPRLHVRRKRPSSACPGRLPVP